LADLSRTGQVQTVGYFLQSSHPIRIIIAMWTDVLGVQKVGVAMIYLDAREY
jgi:hypothetical protein